MEESRKKPIMIAVIVVCFGVAAAITLRGRGPSDDVSSDETIWVKCANRACGHSFETNAKEYYKFQQDTYNPDTEESAGMTCPKSASTRIAATSFSRERPARTTYRIAARSAK